jgi:hypothetical protein
LSFVVTTLKRPIIWILLPDNEANHKDDEGKSKKLQWVLLDDAHFSPVRYPLVNFLLHSEL